MMSSRSSVSSNMASSSRPHVNDGLIRITIVDQEEERTRFRIGRNTPIAKLLRAYYVGQKKTKGSIVFLLNGERISNAQMSWTPNNLGIDDGDEISAMEQATGG